MRKRKSKFFGFLLFIICIFIFKAGLADEFSLKDSNGVQYRLSGLRGKWVLVNFWAPWCTSCIHEIPELIALQKSHHNLQVIGIAMFYKNNKEVISILTKSAINFPIVMGNDSSEKDFGGLDVLPTSYLYSPSGKLVGHFQRPITKQEIEDFRID